MNFSPQAEKAEGIHLNSQPYRTALIFPMESTGLMSLLRSCPNTHITHTVLLLEDNTASSLVPQLQ